MIALAEVADSDRPVPAGDRLVEVPAAERLGSRFDFVPGLRSFHGVDQNHPGRS